MRDGVHDSQEPFNSDGHRQVDRRAEQERADEHEVDGDLGCNQVLEWKTLLLGFQLCGYPSHC